MQTNRERQAAAANSRPGEEQPAERRHQELEDETHRPVFGAEHVIRTEGDGRQDDRSPLTRERTQVAQRGAAKQQFLPHHEAGDQRQVGQRREHGVRALQPP